MKSPPPSLACVSACCVDQMKLLSPCWQKKLPPCPCLPRGAALLATIWISPALQHRAGEAFGGWFITFIKWCICHFLITQRLWSNFPRKCTPAFNYIDTPSSIQSASLLCHIASKVDNIDVINSNSFKIENYASAGIEFLPKWNKLEAILDIYCAARWRPPAGAEIWSPWKQCPDHRLLCWQTVVSCLRAVEYPSQ